MAIYYVNILNDSRDPSGKTTLSVWEIELVKSKSGTKAMFDEFRWIKKIYDPVNIFKVGRSKAFQAPVNIIYGRKSLIIDLFRRWRNKYET